jgi:hypothetical protein
LDFATDALDSYQKIITLTLASKLGETLPDRGPTPGADRSRLFIRDLARGSMGFILEEIAPEQQEMLPTVLKDAVEGATEFPDNLNSSTDEALDTILETTQPRLVSAVQRFTKILYDAGASTQIVGDQHRLSLSIHDLGQLSRRLGDIEITEQMEAVDGVLLGVLPDSRQFELKPPGDDVSTIKGEISEELALKYTVDTSFKEQLLLQPVRAQLNHIRTVRNGRVVREQRILEAIEPARSRS